MRNDDNLLPKGRPLIMRFEQLTHAAQPLKVYIAANESSRASDSFAGFLFEFK
jgi:hypothetical protein